MLGTGVLMVVLGVIAMAYAGWAYDVMRELRVKHPLEKCQTFIVGAMTALIGVPVIVYAAVTQAS